MSLPKKSSKSTSSGVCSLASTYLPALSSIPLNAATLFRSSVSHSGRPSIFTTHIHYSPSAFGSQPKPHTLSADTLVSIPASMPKKTADSIVTHVQRLRKQRMLSDARSAFRPVSRPVQSIAVPTVVTTTPVLPEPAQLEPITPAPLVFKKVQLPVVSEPAPLEAAAPAPLFIKKVQLPVISEPAPLEPAPLFIKKKVSLPVIVDLAQDDIFTPAPLSFKKAVQPAPVDVPFIAPLAFKKKTLRSCLRSGASTAAPKRVCIPEHDGWNRHLIRAFDPDAPSNTFIALEDAILQQPSRSRGRQCGKVWEGEHHIVRDPVDKQLYEYRWPPPALTPPEPEENSGEKSEEPETTIV